MESIIQYSKSLRYKTYIRNLEIYDLRVSLLSRVASRADISTKLHLRAITTQEYYFDEKHRISSCYDYYKAGARLLQYKR